MNARLRYSGIPSQTLNTVQRAAAASVQEKVRDGRYRFESSPCLLCHDTDFHRVAEQDRYGLYMPVVICRRCGLVQTNPRMSQDAYAAFYNEEYRPLYGGVTQPTELFFERQRLYGRKIVRYLQRRELLRSDSRVLEVGCGAGGALTEFVDAGCHASGLDVGADYVLFGRVRHQLDLHVGTVASSALGGHYDIVVYHHVLEHILDPISELKAVRDLLAPGGIVFITVPGIKSLGAYKNDFSLYLQNAHVWHFSLRTLSNVLRAAGFTRLDGNENINALFQLDAERTSGEHSLLESDYASALRHLRWTERLRRLPPRLLTQLWRLHRQLARCS